MLSTTLSSITLSSCLMNAAGCPSQLDDLANSKSGAIISKSGTISPRQGNPFPRIYFDEHGTINSVGLANPSYSYYSNLKFKKPFIQSIYPFNLSELETMLLNVNTDIVEINLSCPNVSINHDFETYEKYFDKISQQNSNKIVGIKMPHLFIPQHFQIMSNLLLKNSINFITCCNSLPGGLILHDNKFAISNEIGGIGGRYIKPFSLANVYQYHKLLHDKIDIIGCGGISTGKDIFDYISVGAKAVQVGTQLLKEGISCFTRLEDELMEIMKKNKYDNIESFRGIIRPKL